MSLVIVIPTFVKDIKFILWIRSKRKRNKICVFDVVFDCFGIVLLESLDSSSVVEKEELDTPLLEGSSGTVLTDLLVCKQPYKLLGMGESFLRPGQDWIGCV
jgi:hypothetical protein